MLIKRRQFLQTGSLATASFLVPKFLKAFEKSASPVLPAGNKVVVVLQLSGGNDGLNTVIPVGNDIYYRSRQHIGIPKNEALLLSDDAGLHPALTGFKTLYEDGSLGILNSVGYPNPDRSHFRSMDIWQTASDSNSFLTTGWIGRYLDACCPGTDSAARALELDDILSLALKGEREKAIAFKSPARLYNTSNEQYFRDLSKMHPAGDPEHQPVDYLYKTMAETLSSAGYIYKQSKLRPSSGIYPPTELGNDLKTIASLIFSDIDTRIYYLSLGSFDTHVNQLATQDRLFKEMDAAVTAFVKDLKSNGRFDEVLLFTFSEFGRRVAQNASGGTDHGTANNMFLISGGLQQKGLINPLADLENLTAGDLNYSIDFKNVYATVLNKWLGADELPVMGKKYDLLGFV